MLQKAFHTADVEVNRHYLHFFPPFYQNFCSIFEFFCKILGEDNLMPEADFLARNISPVTFRVVMPDMPDKPEWKLHGQTIAVTLPLSDPISALKARLFDETGMQAGKQKLQMENIFFKDTNTLAYYNIYPATVVHLQVKERGGRKK